jgi:hypothetical protein
MVAVGTTSCSSSGRFAPSSTFRVATPVRLPPGRFKLVTSPAATGSTGTLKMIGMSVVAALPRVLLEYPPQQSRSPDDERDRWPVPAIDWLGPPPSGIRSPHYGFRHTRFRSGLCGSHANG